jgi:hypothetical protein
MAVVGFKKVERLLSSGTSMEEYSSFFHCGTHLVEGDGDALAGEKDGSGDDERGDDELHGNHPMT